MANTITGKVWSLDTAAGIVCQTPVTIHAFHVRFTTAGAGSLTIQTCPKDGVAETILDLKTTAASTAAAYILDARYTMGDQVFLGLNKTLSVNVDTIYVVTGICK